jgi:EAL domain-containing protein (putative c-di-GMP-specific phosphodiesterase class I)
MAYQLNCLIVDDDPIFTVVAESILKTLTSGTIAKATNGLAGLDLLRTHAQPDLIFLDLNMPDLDGLAFMRAASESDFSGSIVISSGESAAIVRSAEAMGKMLGVSVVGSLRKPLTIEEASNALARAENAAKVAARSSVGPASDAFELTPYFQPQYDLRSNTIVGLEALIRLTARDGRVHGPAQLFDSVETLEQLTEVSQAIASKVLSDSKRWLQNAAGPEVSINFDASVLEQPDVVVSLQNALIDLNLEPHRLCLEVTEKSLPREPARLIEGLTRLRMAGFRLSLDDYGTGASSFELLRLCPFSEIKVDRSIIEACTTDPITRKFLHAVAGLARDLDLTSVAEGVETELELAEVRAARIDRVQGFLYSRPVPPAVVDELIR